MVGKKGEGKYYIIISLILGLMVLLISLSFIFNEYFTEGEIDWEKCRQSILLRANSPNLEDLGTDMKGAFSLKCKTEVVNVDSAENPDEVFEKVAETVSSGWYMFGEGKYDFVHRSFWESQTLCLAYARIHYTSKAFKDYDDNMLWVEAFREDYNDLEMSKHNQAELAPLSFIDYYKTTELADTGRTYNKYLPIFEGTANKEGNFAVYWEGVDFIPKEDGLDYIVVYRINKIAGKTSTLVGSFAKNLVPKFLSDYAWTDEKAKEWEGQKSIILISPDKLGEIGCDKFLTIPA